MNLQEEKCVLVIDEDLPLGLITNTAAVLGITIGQRIPEIVGADIPDGSGHTHVGLTGVPIPILKASSESLQALREKLFDEAYSDLLVVDFQDVAQSCLDYADYTKKLAAAAEEGLCYFGLAICGAKKKVNKLTGNLPLLR
jgi:hypothetical protein